VVEIVGLFRQIRQQQPQVIEWNDAVGLRCSCRTQNYAESVFPVWLFDTALIGLVGLGKRKAGVSA
jgi:hypothetical protein